MEYAITLSEILGFCSLIAAIWGVWKIVKELKKPSDDMKAMVAKHEEKLFSEGKRLTGVEESNKMILQCLLVLIDHNLTNNGVDKMKEMRNKLRNFLIEK